MSTKSQKKTPSEQVEQNFDLDFYTEKPLKPGDKVDLTYDLYSMTGKEILNLLPSEFDRWRQGALDNETG